MYNNLKLSANGHDGSLLLPHINKHEMAYPDSTSHLLHHTIPHATALSPSAVAAASQLAAGESAAAYHGSYASAFRSGDGVVTGATSSNDTEYVINSNVVTSNQSANAVTTSSSASMHQRRGSLQLWQFLVALLDEPSAR